VCGYGLSALWHDLRRCVIPHSSGVVLPLCVAWAFFFYVLGSCIRDDFVVVWKTGSGLPPCRQAPQLFFSLGVRLGSAPLQLRGPSCGHTPRTASWLCGYVFSPAFVVATPLVFSCAGGRAKEQNSCCVALCCVLSLFYFDDPVVDASP